MDQHRPDRPDLVFDQGVQQERTALAWQRTSLSLAAAGALYLHATADRALLLVPGVAMLLLGALTMLSGWRRYERLHQALHAGSPITTPRAVATLATATTLFSACALLLALLAP